MAREKDPAEIVETIAQSIRVSQRGARKVKAHRFKELFGYQVLNAPRREKIEQLMAAAGIDHLATGMAPTAIFTEARIASDLVGDTGIEPVTSSV